MGLGLVSNNGSTGEDFLPYLSFNAVSGEAIVKWKEKEGEEYVAKEKELTWPAKFIADMQNIEVGYIYFSAAGPKFNLVKLGQPLPERPQDKDAKGKYLYSAGFRVKLYNKELGAFIFSNSSKTISESMDVLHDSYVAGLAKNAGKVPVIEIKGTHKIAKKTKEGMKNYKQPDWSIVSWVARPEALTEKVAKAAKEVETSDDDEF